MQKYQFTEEQKAEIEAAYRTATDKVMAKRLKVLYLYSHGESLEGTVEKTGVGRTSVARYSREYRANGLVNLTKPNERFTPEQVAGLRKAYGEVSPDDVPVHRCLKALLLLAEGVDLQEAAGVMGHCSITNVEQVASAYKRGGVAAIISRYHRKKPASFTKYSFTAEQKVEIEQAYRTVASKRGQERLEVLRLRAEGKTIREVSEATGFHQTTVSYIIRKYHAAGLGAIDITAPCVFCHLRAMEQGYSLGGLCADCYNRYHRDATSVWKYPKALRKYRNEHNNISVKEWLSYANNAKKFSDGLITEGQFRAKAQEITDAIIKLEEQRIAGLKSAEAITKDKREYPARYLPEIFC